MQLIEIIIVLLAFSNASSAFLGSSGKFHYPMICDSTFKLPQSVNGKKKMYEPVGSKLLAFNCEDLTANRATQEVESWLKITTCNYNECLRKAPLLTKAISSAAVAGIGDLLIQLINQKNSKLTGFIGGQAVDFRRTLVFSTVAGLYTAPVIHLWYNWLQELPLPDDMSNTSKSLVMVALDQTVGAVAVTSGFFMVYEIVQRLIPPHAKLFEMPLLQRGMDSINKNLWDTLQVNWCYWPAVNFANFRFVPLQYRVLFANFASVFWNMYLSKIVNA